MSTTAIRDRVILRWQPRGAALCKVLLINVRLYLHLAHVGIFYARCGLSLESASLLLVLL